MVGVILESVGFLCTSFIPSLACGYLTLGILVGMGSGFAIFASNSMLLDWFSGQRNCCRATGAVTIGGSVGTFVCVCSRYFVLENDMKVSDVASCDWLVT